MIVTISKGQQITIPAEMRKKLKLKIGSRVEMINQKDKIIIQPIGEDLEDMFEKSKHIKPKHNLTAEQMDELNEGLFR